MNQLLRRSPFALLAVGAVLAFAACTDNTRTMISSSSESTGVTVSGHGEVAVPSDTGYFDVGVDVTKTTVAEAQSTAATAAAAVIASIKSNGIDALDIKTTGLSIQPQYTYPKDGGPGTIVGYQVMNTVSVKVKKLDSFSKVIDDATEAGGDAVRLGSIRFDVDNRDAALEQARKAAMADARKKAEQLADAGGVGLGDPVSIQESSPTQQPIAYAAAASLKSFATTPIEAGAGTIAVDVVVRWAMK